jgi:hypothetical protein
MALAQTFTPSDTERPSAGGLVAIVLVMVALFVAFGLVVYWGVAPAVTKPAGDHAALPNRAASEACLSATERAKHSRGLSSQEAIAASTAMLRACSAG